jgi:phosphoglycerate kinase
VRDILARAEAAGCTVHLPYEVVVTKEFKANAPHRVCNVHDVAADEMILDLGPAAVEALGDAMKTCRTLVWNGPMGAFELEPFDAATVALARIAAAGVERIHGGKSDAGSGELVFRRAHGEA